MWLLVEELTYLKRKRKRNQHGRKKNTPQDVLPIAEVAGMINPTNGKREKVSRTAIMETSVNRKTTKWRNTKG